MTVKDDYKRACVALAICHQMLNEANDKVEALKEENENLREKITELLCVKHGLEFDYSEQQKALTRIVELFTSKIEPQLEKIQRTKDFGDFDEWLYCLKSLIELEALHES